MTTPCKRRTAIHYLALAAAILLGAWWLRSVEIMRMPLFLDEAIHIGWAQAVLRGGVYIGVYDNKWLYPVVLALFHPTGPEAPWLARTVGALLGTLSTAGCIALGRQMSSRSAGLWAGLIYALLPFAVFHERQALVDPLVAALALLATLSTLRLALDPGPGAAALMILTLTGAYLTKVAAVPYFGLALVAPLLLGRSWRARGQALLWGILAVGAALGAMTLLLNLSAQKGIAPLPFNRLAAENTVFGGDPADVLARLRADLATLGEILILYVGWGLLGLAAVSLLTAIRSAGWRRILFLSIPALGFAAIPLLSVRPAGILAPRYLLAGVAPLAVLAAVGMEELVSRLAARRWRALAMLLVLGAAIGPALSADARIIWQPLLAHLPNPDQQQYQTGLASGRGHVELAHALLADWSAARGAPVDVLYAGSFAPIFVAYLGPRVGTFIPLQDTPEQRALVGAWLGAGHRVFVVQASRDSITTAGPSGARLEERGRYSGALEVFGLYEIVGAEDPLAAAIYHQLGTAPERIGGDYAAITQASWLPGTSVIIFPPAHADAFAAAGFDVLPLQPETWPMQRADLEAAYRDFDLGERGDLISVVLADETATDSDRLVQLTLDSRLYYLSQDWFGMLHRRLYLTGPAEPPLSPVGARVEGGIELIAAALVDPSSRPGGMVRMALAWQTPAPIGDPYSIFVHVFDSAGTLWAQHDGDPGGGLFPLTSWQPGQVIGDRFAIVLPPDVPPGVYEIRVGIYHPGSGLRLPVIAGPGAGGDNIPVGWLEVVSGE